MERTLHFNAGQYVLEITVQKKFKLPKNQDIEINIPDGYDVIAKCLSSDVQVNFKILETK